MTPLVSVIVATYRREAPLERALNSLAEQTFSQFEIIVVDDNSTPEWNQKVNNIITSFQCKYPQIELCYIVNEKNRGSAQTRNIGIEEARGTYITFLDDDDIYLPEKINRQVNFMLRGNYDYSVTDLDLYNENDQLIDRRTRSNIQETTQQALLEYHLKHHITGTDTMMFRKEYLVEIGKFAPIDVGDEFYLMHRAIEGNGSFGHLNGSDIKAYVHTGENDGISSGESKIKGENDLYEYKKKFFEKLDSKSVRYIKMRHYAVLAFAEMRRKKYGAFIKYAAKSFLTSPVACVGLLLGAK